MTRALTSSLLRFYGRSREPLWKCATVSALTCHDLVCDVGKGQSCNFKSVAFFVVKCDVPFSLVVPILYLPRTYAAPDFQGLPSYCDQTGLSSGAQGMEELYLTPKSIQKTSKQDGPPSTNIQAKVRTFCIPKFQSLTWGP